MIPRALAEKTKRMIEINAEIAVINGVYFNPSFAQKLNKKVPELIPAGISITQTIVDTPQGQVIEASGQASNGVLLELGAVILDGKDVSPQGNLATIDTLISFVEQNAKQTV